MRNSIAKKLRKAALGDKETSYTKSTQMLSERKAAKYKVPNVYGIALHHGCARHDYKRLKRAYKAL